MLFSKCIELKQMIDRYNRKQSLSENCIRCRFCMFTDGEWSCTIETKGCVSVRDFGEIYNYIATLYVDPFMFGSRLGFKVHII